MSSDIEKLAVFDPRIIQKRPVYGVEKGALSVSNAPYNAISETASQHTYNIYVPSENVFVDRHVNWTSLVAMQFQVAVAGALAAGDPLVQAGKDFSLCAFPLNSLCQTISATINDTTSVINTQDVLQQVLRMTDYKRNRLMRTCPTALDCYQNYDDAYGTVNNPIGGYDTASDWDRVPNGAFGGLYFTTPTGSPLGTATPAFAGAPYNAVNGVPVYDGATAGPYPIYIKFRSTEPIVLSPFCFADSHELSTGLFGINNIQLIMNLNSSVDRIIRRTSRNGRTISSVAFGATPFTDSRVNVQFLTPNLSVDLPTKSVIGYIEFPRYLSAPQTVSASGASQIISQTITLPMIPDMLLVFVRPTSYSGSDADWVFPVATGLDGINQPLSVQFDNFSGLLSAHTAEELYSMSVLSGLDMDYNTWIGKLHCASGGYAGRQAGQVVPSCGGPLVLKFGRDIALQSGQAPSLVGNFTLQLSLQVTNPTGIATTGQMVIITANSGFFESIRGSSRIIKGVLSEQDIISAPPTDTPMERVVGGFSFSSLANVLSKAKSFYEKTKPIVSAVKGALPEEGMMGKVKGALGAVGYGVSAGAPSGGARRGKMSLAERLM